MRLVLTPHPAPSHAFAKASARTPRRGNPSVACLNVRTSRASSATFGDSVVVLTFLRSSGRRLLEPKRSFNSTSRRRTFLPLLGLRAEALAKAWERAG